MAAIDRNDVASLITEGFATDFLNTATEGSGALAAFDVVNMGSKTTVLPVIATDPEAKWVGEYTDGGSNATAIKPTSKVAWASQKLVAEEIAVVVPVHENLIEDASVDVLAEVTRRGGKAIAKKLDAAIFHGTDKPATWSTKALQAASTASTQEFTVGTNASDLLDALAQAEVALADQGYDDLVLVTRTSINARLRNERDKNGAFLGASDILSDYSPVFSKNLATGTEAFLVAREQVRVGVRSDIKVRLLSEATLTGVGNLAELDMVGLRFAARYAYVLGNDKAVARIVSKPASPGK